MNETLQAILYGLLGAFLYDRVLKPLSTRTGAVDTPVAVLDPRRAPASVG